MKRFIAMLLCCCLAFGLTGGFFENSLADMSITADAANEITMPYYYYQLSDSDKKIYKKIRTGILDCKEEIKISSSLTKNQIASFAELIYYYDPMTYNVQQINTSSSSTYVKFKMTYYKSKEKYNQNMAEVEKSAKTIIKKIKSDMSTYQKIQLIHDEIIASNEYNQTTSDCDNLYGAFVTNKIKCNGYSKAFTYLCNKVGIRSIIVKGDDLNGGNIGHEWNKVHYNNKWYNIDCTYDDPVCYLTNNSAYCYFMVSDNALKNTHKQSETTFSVPAAKDNTLNYYAKKKLSANTYDDGKTLMSSQLKKAATKKQSMVTIKFNSEKEFKKAIKYWNDDDLRNIMESASSEYLTGKFIKFYDENMYTFTIMVFYPDTPLSDYFTSKKEISEDFLNYLAKNGIK